MKKLFPVFVMCAVLLAGCGFAGENYRNYVTAILDCTYHGESSAYCELTNTSELSADAIWQTEFQELNQMIFDTYSIRTDLISEETREGYQRLTKMLLMKTKYNVRDVMHENQTYTVVLVLSPFDFWEISQEKVRKYYYSEFFRNFRTAPTQADADKLEQEYASRILEILTDSAEHLDYLEPVVYTCTIQNNTVSAEDWQAIDRILLNLE